MGRMRTLTTGALNVVIQAGEHHNPNSYEKLFYELFDLNTPLKLRGEEYLVVGGLQPAPDGAGLIGVLDRFVSIESFNWYNSKKRRPASADEMRRIRIPNALEANHREYPFYFDLGTHRLVFLASDVGLRLNPLQVQAFVSALSSDIRIVRTFGSVSVTVEQEIEGLSRILDAPRLRQISITINRPNADSLAAFDATFMRQLEEQRAARLLLELRADTEDSLAPNNYARKLAALATSNGSVDAKIIDDGIVKSVSSRDYPLLERVSYSTSRTDQMSAFLSAARQMIRRILSKK